jgi:transglutaminase-like putative cysteine protease
VRFTLTHRTAYRYAGAVHESFNEVRLQPLSSDTQTCLAFDLSIDPPATVITFRDYYGNTVHDFSIPYPHDHLTIEATSDVITFADATTPISGPQPGEADLSPPLADLAADPLIADEQAEFLSPSTYVALGDASLALAQSLLNADPVTTAFGFLQRAAAHIRGHFTYQLGATNVHSTVADVIAGGSGVCQDYAHLLLSLCRHVGLPARYVSGYLGDVAQSGASHAWAEAFVPPYGWVGIDPTLGLPCTGRHVKIAVGRDYADVAVVRGTYRGSAEATLDVEVRGAVRDDARALTAARAGEERGHGKLIQFQTLGAMKQFQRLGAMSQTLGTMTQTLGTLPDGFHGQSGEPDAPRQQPQQQQQCLAIIDR